MNIDHLKEFAHLANTLNFSTTAQHFYVSTSVISRHIASLEDELGFKLFDRGSRRIELTEAGMRLRRRAEEIVDISEGSDLAFRPLEPALTADVHIAWKRYREFSPAASAFLDKIRELWS